jgi:hypothetical protein
MDSSACYRLVMSGSCVFSGYCFVCRGACEVLICSWRPTFAIFLCYDANWHYACISHCNTSGLCGWE